MANTVAETPDARGDLARLVGLLAAHAPYDGHFDLRLQGVEAIRASRVTGELVHGVAKPAMCIVAQGAKKVFLGNEIFDYDASRLLVYSVDVPISGQITRASQAEPFLCLKVELDPERIADLTLKVYPHGFPQNPKNLAISVTPAEPGILKAAARLVELLAQPEDAEWIAPLMVEEILLRLLRSPIGSRVAQIGQEGSRVQRVAQAVSWVRTNFDRPLDVERLAGLVHMSVSTFHQHF
ncbi:MAG: AraC family transcriptional regulator N-terminal domain-containing protein, partial [Holophaga sp.]|nr:AraC family transcriptional regulator N-terminal domain-containing protein [Holophaga sp.]